MITEDYKTFIDELRCPNCGKVCEDNQQDSEEPYKEEYCGGCDEQFGYEEKITYEDNLDDWKGEGFGQYEIRHYWSYKI